MSICKECNNDIPKNDIAICHYCKNEFCNDKNCIAIESGARLRKDLRIYCCYKCDEGWGVGNKYK